jgi:hypothetical protein
MMEEEAVRPGTARVPRRGRGSGNQLGFLGGQLIVIFRLTQEIVAWRQGNGDNLKTCNINCGEER